MENSSKPMQREELLKLIRETFKEKGRRLGLNDFLAARSLRRKDVFKNFSRWEEALRAAGCEKPAKNAPVDSETLLVNWGKVAEKVRRIPTQKDYAVHGCNAQRTLTCRFGSWNCISQAFRNFARR